MSWSALAQLPVWAQASQASKKPQLISALPTEDGCITYLLGARAAQNRQESTEVVHMIQRKGTELMEKRLLIDVRWKGDSEPEPFEQLLVAFGGRALALLSRSCCAVALPEDRAEAVVVRAEGKSFQKVAWHPLSDAHLGVLYDDGSWSLMNLALSLEEPELHFVAEEPVVDFVFVDPQLQVDCWLSLSVFFLSSTGHISCRGPVLPSLAVMRRAHLEELLASATEPFAEALVRGLTASRSPLGDDLVVVSHRQHLHGDMMSLSSLEPRLVRLEEPGGNSSSSFSCLEVCCCSPLVVLARAREGIVELVALEQLPGPSVTSIEARVLEEVDLLCKSGQEDWLRLSPGEGGVYCLSRTLLAWLEVTVQAASVTTLSEARSEAEFASFCPVAPCVGLLLRRERGSRAKPALKVIEVAKKETSKPTAAIARKPPSSLALLQQPLAASLGGGQAPAELAKRCAQMRSGLASIQCRQEFLKHLSSKSFPARAEVIREELALDAAELSRRSGAAARRCEELRLRQAELVRRQQDLVRALSAAAESASLEELNDTALPKLYAQLYELRRAGELLKSSRGAARSM